MRNRKKLGLAGLVLAVGLGLFSIGSAVTGHFDLTVRVVNEAGTVLNGVASAVTAQFDKTVRIVDENGNVIHSFSGGGGGAPSGPAGGALNGTYPNPGIDPVPGITSQGTHTSGNVLNNGYAFNAQFLANTQGGMLFWGEPYILTVAALNPTGSTPDPIVLDAADGACTAAAPAIGGGTAECIVHWTGAAWVYVAIPDGPVAITDSDSGGGEVLQITGFWNDGGNVQYRTSSAGGAYNVGNSLLKLNHADLEVGIGSTFGVNAVVDTAGTGPPNFPNGLKAMVVAVASLGTCDAGADGTTKIANDALNAGACVIGTTVTAGGSTYCGVVCQNGTGWVHY